MLGRMKTLAPSAASLRAIKIVHTAIWACFAAAIVAIPFLAWAGRYAAALICIAIVFAEVLVLVFNGWSCPLTGVAARHTGDRRDNFDIYLPEWLARHNKTVFGILYVAGVAFALIRWATR